MEDVCESKNLERKRWEPDLQLIPAVMAGGGRKMSQLSTSDRCWLVAGLTLAGLTADEIADRLSCSLRLVRSIRAEDMTAMCTFVQVESTNFTNELRLSNRQARHTATMLAAAQAELERTRDKLNRMIDAHVVGVKCCPKCSTPMAGYNLYEWNGKKFCRECQRQRVATHRQRTRLYGNLPFKVATAAPVITR